MKSLAKILCPKEFVQDQTFISQPAWRAHDDDDHIFFSAVSAELKSHIKLKVGVNEDLNRIYTWSDVRKVKGGCWSNKNKTVAKHVI